MSLTKDLRQWRKDRNITSPNTKVYVANQIEELLEIFIDDKKEIKYLQSEIMDKYFDREPISEENTTDSILDSQVFSINEIELMGYDNELCNKEVFKEINSRKQCPIQKEDWEDGNKVRGEKWLKDPNQSEDTKYKADYSKCKLKG